MQILIHDIKSLIGIENKPKLLLKGKEMATLNCIENAWLLIEKDKIAAFGKMSETERLAKIKQENKLKLINASGRLVFPSFCDTHTHLVYAGSREIEYIDKIKGLSYEEIAKRGGGILNSAARLHNASEEELVAGAMERLNEIISFGTGAVEIKSGYGLSTEDELKMLRVIKKLKAKFSKLWLFGRLIFQPVKDKIICN